MFNVPASTAVEMPELCPAAAACDVAIACTWSSQIGALMVNRPSAFVFAASVVESARSRLGLITCLVPPGGAKLTTSSAVFELEYTSNSI